MYMYMYMFLPDTIQLLFYRSSTDTENESPKTSISSSPKSEYVYFYQGMYYSDLLTHVEFYNNFYFCS